MTCYTVINDKLSKPYKCKDDNLTQSDVWADVYHFGGKKYSYERAVKDGNYSIQTLNGLPTRSFSRSATYPHQVLKEITDGSQIHGLLCSKNAKVEICVKDPNDQ